MNLCSWLGKKTWAQSEGEEDFNPDGANSVTTSPNEKDYNSSINSSF